MRKENITQLVKWILQGTFLYGIAVGLYGIQLGIAGGYVRLFTLMVLSGATLGMILLNGIDDQKKQYDQFMWYIAVLVLCVLAMFFNTTLGVWMLVCSGLVLLAGKCGSMVVECMKNLAAFVLTGRIFEQYVQGGIGYSQSLLLFFVMMLVFFREEKTEKQQTIFHDGFLVGVKCLKQLSFTGIFTMISFVTNAMYMQGNGYDGIVHTVIIVLLFVIHCGTGLIDRQYTFENREMNMYASLIVRGIAGCLIAAYMMKAGGLVMLIAILTAVVPIAVWYLLQFTKINERNGFQIAGCLALTGGMMMLMMLYNGVTVDGQLITFFVMSQVSLLWI